MKEAIAFGQFGHFGRYCARPTLVVIIFTRQHLLIVLLGLGGCTGRSIVLGWALFSPIQEETGELALSGIRIS